MYNDYKFNGWFNVHEDRINEVVKAKDIKGLMEACWVDGYTVGATEALREEYHDKKDS